MEENKIKPISLFQFVDLTKPGRGIVVYKGTSGQTIHGNKISYWEVIERNLCYYLSSMGISPLVIDEKNIDTGSYVSSYQTRVEEIEEILDEKPFRYKSRGYFEDLLKKNQEAKFQDESFVRSVANNGVGLWLSGCFCCLGDYQVPKIASFFKKGKCGIIVPKDSCYMDLNRKDGFSRYGANDKYVDHFVFVDPELGLKY